MENSGTPDQAGDESSESQRREVMRSFETPAAAGAAAKVFKYRKPEFERSRAIVPLCKSDILIAATQVIRQGGETNLHSHTGMDGFWFVLKGQARFYGPDNVLQAELGTHDGIFIPRGVPYWFESTGSEDLELLQVEAFAKGVKNVRIDHEPLKKRPPVEMFDAVGSERPLPPK